MSMSMSFMTWMSAFFFFRFSSCACDFQFVASWSEVLSPPLLAQAGASLRFRVS